MASYLDELMKKNTVKEAAPTTSSSKVTETAPATKTVSGSTKQQSSGSYLDQLMEKHTVKKSSVTIDADYINSFISDANRYYENTEKEYSSIGYTNGSSVYESRKKQTEDLRKRSSEIRNYLENNKDSLDAENYNAMKSYLDEFDKTSTQSLYEFYRAANNDSRFEDYDSGASSVGWEAYSAEKERKQAEEEEKSWIEKAIAMLGGSSDTTLPGANITQVTNSYREDTSYREPTDKWNDDLRNAFGYLYSKDPEDAFKFAEEINNQLNAQEKEAQRKQVQEKATTSFWDGAKHTAGALLTAPLGLADYLNDVAEYNARGKITEHGGGMSPFEYSQAVTGGVSQHLNEKYGTLNEKIPVIGGKGLGDVYGLGTSIAQSALAGYTGGQTGTLIQFFGSAAASGVDEAKQRGADDSQAMKYGTMVGAAEGLAEMIGVDNLLNIGASSTMRELIINVAKQGVAEGLEEGITSVLNNFADQLTMGDMSNFNVLVRDYMNKGWSEEEAKKQAWLDMAEDIAYDVLGGFISGSVHAGPQTAYQTYAQNKQIRSVYGDSVSELVQQGLESAEGSLSHELAVKYQEKLEGGGTLSGAEINRLVKANEQEFLAEDKASIKQSAENRLTELGEFENVSELAEILTKQATKQKLTRAEQNMLRTSLYGERVSNELNPKNVGSGEYSNTWAGQIGTSRINADAYNQDLMALANEMSGVDASRTEQSLPGQENETKSDKVVTENKQVTERQYEASDSGETIIKSTGEAVDIKEVATIKDGQMTLRLTDGRTVDANDVSYASQNDAVVYEAVAHMGVNSAAANVLVNAYHPDSGVSASIYAHGIQEAYRYGQYSYPVQELARGPFSSMLTEQQRNTAYKLGKMFGGKQVAVAQATIKKSLQVANKNATVGKTVGKVHFDGDRSTLTERQSASLSTLETVADVLGVQIHVFESQVDENGKRIGANGWFDPKDNSIHIDLHAGVSGEATMLFTASHELTHFVKQWSPAKFKTLSNFMMKEYGQKGVSVDVLVHKQIEKAERSGRTISYDVAFEEVIADSMETMLADGNVVEKLAKLKQQDRSLWQKIKDFISELAAKIRKVYEGLTPDSEEGRYVAEMKDSIEKLQELFVEGLVEASENYQSSLTPGEEGVVVNQNGEPVAHATADGTVLLSMRTYEEDGREAFRKYLQKCVTNKSITKAEMQEMMDGIEDIYQTCKEFKDKYAPFSSWSDAAVVRDTRGKPVFSVVTPNGDYKMNLDFSLVCKKRRTLDAVFNEMSRRGIIDDFELGQKSVVKINEIIRKHGLETACALCFVDAKRFRQASMADQFTSLYNELVESLVPEDQKGSIDHFNFSGYATIKQVADGIHTWNASKLDFSHINHVLKTYGDGTVEYKAAKYIKSHPEGRKLLLRGDFMSSQGFDAVKSQNQDILKLYNSKKGTGGPKAAFGDVQYMNEIIQKARWWTPAKAYAVGGVRIQSFSDYVPRMVFDYTQMIYDLAATKLPAHAYTKEALFVKQFGLTGVKINMSLIPAIAEGGIAPGLDANGNYVWAGESFDYETAKEIQNAEGYTENCGTICVGVSDRHIRKLLSDPDIRMVIPYHKSGLNPIVAHMNKIAEFTDYTNKQNTTVKETGSKAEKHFDFNKALHDMGENADPRAVIQQYFDWCDDNGYDPKFAEFRDHPNYYKLIEDFTLFDKDGKYVPQREVRAVFPKADSAFGSMKDLIQEGLQEDAVVEGKRDKSLSSIVDEIQKTLPKTEAEIEETQVEQADRDLEATENFYSDVLYSERVTDKETLNFLNKQETITTYKTMQIVDGKLYPPMAARTNGAYEDYSELGAWEQATEHPELIKNGNKFKLDKGKGQGSIEAAYNPYMHSSNLVLNDQFSGAYTRDNLVTVECEVPVSELTSGYHAQYAKDSVGWHAWHTGTVAGSLRKARGIERQVFLSRWIKPVRIVPDSEVASMYKDLLGGTDIAVPDNVVTPSLLKELKNAGVKIKESGRVKYSDRDTDSVSNRSLLANALESVAKNDIERKRLQEYKEKIGLINAEEKKLRELNLLLRAESDPKRMREIQFDAQQTANRINTYDRQLLRLEASKPLQDVLTREKKMAFDRGVQRGRDALEAYRERAEKKQQETIERYQESRKRGVENRQKTAMRQKIRKTIRDLDKILNRGDKKRNVKEDMKDFVADALSSAEILFTDSYSNEDMVRNGVATDMTPEEAKLMNEARAILDEIANLPTGYEGWQARQETEQKLKGRLAYRMGKLKDVFVRERARLNKTQVSEVLGNLADSYGRLQNSEYAHVQGAYHESVHEYLKMLQEDVGGTIVKDMTIGQLEELYKAYTMVMTTVRNANRMFAENLNNTRDTLANMVMFEVHEAGGEHGLWTKAGDKLNSFSWNNEKPVYAFERIGSKTLKTLFGNIRKGQDGWAVDIQEANDFRMKMYKKYKRSSWNTQKRYKFTSSSGIDFELNLDQIMSLYAYSKRAQAHDHLLKGGFVFDGNTEVVVNKKGLKMTYLNKNATAYNVSFEILEDIISKLTPEQKAFVDDMQEYLSTTMGEKGNEVSMELYGVKLFNEKFYFPLRSAGQYMEKAKEADLKQKQGQVNIANSGFSKAVKIKASNPVVLTGFMEVWAGHVNEMSMYHSFVLPMEDFRRVYNYSSPHMEGQQSASVNGVIQNAYGSAATDYIDRLYRDLNGGAITDNTAGPINKLMGLFKKGAVFASASVTIQQPSAVARATALVDIKHFSVPKVDHKRHKALWEEVKKYAPVAVIKEMGFFDTNMGRSATDFLTAEEYSGINEKAKALVKDESYRDEMLSKAPALADELTWCVIWEAVKRETKARNPKMNVKSEEFLKLAGDRFSEVIDKTQVYDSVLARSANMRSKDTGMKMATAFMAEPTTSINMVADALRKGKKGNKKQAARIIGSVVSSVILNSFLVAWVYAARDDDEDETFREKYISAFLSGIKDGVNPMTYIPFLKDIVSIMQGYDVERSDMAVVSDLWNAWKQLKSDDVSAWRKVEGFVGSICQIFGLPVKNIMRDTRSLFQAYNTIVHSEENTTRGTAYAIVEGLTGQKDSNSEQLYKARKAGDEEHAARVEGRYDDEKSANAAVRKSITDRYMDGDLTMAQATMQLTQYAGMKADEAYWLMDGWKHKKETGSDEGYNKYNAFYEAVQTGKDLKAVIKTYTDNGVKTSTLSGQITSHFKDEYVQMSAGERANIKGYLVNAFEQCGVSRENAEERLREWDFEAKHGGSYEEIVAEYKNGEINEATMRNILADKGYSKSDIEDKIHDWNTYKIYGYEYSKLDDAYRAGELSREEFRQAMIDNGTFPAKADQAIVTYDWMRDNAQYGLEYADAGKYAHPIQNYGRSLDDVGLDPNIYLEYKELKQDCQGIDGDNDGKADNGTLRAAKFEMIDSLPITNDQKDALAAIDYGMSSIKKYAPWH